MTPHDVFLELLDRLAAMRGKTALITQETLERWPGAGVNAVIAQKIISRAVAAKSAICPGCEQACAMPVEILRRKHGDVSMFVVCDKRSDVNRVEIAPSQLVQWQFNLSTLAQFIATELGIEYRGNLSGNGLELGMARGRRRSQILCLLASPEITLVAGTASHFVSDVVVFDGTVYRVEAELIAEMVDKSTTGDERYTPSTTRREARKLETAAMHEAWRKEYRSLKRDAKAKNKPDTWYAAQIAKMEIAQGRQAGTILKEIRK